MSDEQPIYRDYLQYDGATGRILARCTLERNSHDAAVAAGMLLLEGTEDPGRYYVQEGVAAARPANPASQSGMTLTGLPVPCKIQIDAMLYDCTDGHAQLSFDEPGTYRVRIIAFPYVDKEFSIEYPAQAPAK